MKILIWIGCMIVFTIIRVFVGYAVTGADGTMGFWSSFLITLAYLNGIIFTARWLCRKWDEHRESKELAKLQSISFEKLQAQLPSQLLEGCRERACDSDALYNYLEQCVNDGMISNPCAQVLYERFAQTQEV